MGLFDPVWCKKSRWISIVPKIIKGIKKWSIKNRVRVALSTANPPQIHWTNENPKYGIADIRFVITVAPQNDIWPQGKTYPIKAAAITNKSRITPMFHVSIKKYEE